MALHIPKTCTCNAYILAHAALTHGPVSIATAALTLSIAQADSEFFKTPGNHLLRFTRSYLIRKL